MVMGGHGMGALAVLSRPACHLWLPHKISQMFKTPFKMYMKAFQFYRRKETLKELQQGVE